MIKINDMRIPTGYTDGDIKRMSAAILNVSEEKITSFKLLKKSLDARKKSDIFWVISAAVEAEGVRPGEAFPEYRGEKKLLSELDIPRIKGGKRVAVIGSGPAGIFAALTLLRAGVKVVIFERGEDVDKRAETVGRFEAGGKLNPESNIQFGEGGAGTFSDGKLNTGTSDSLIGTVYAEFLKHGAPAEIDYIAKPHIGTDYLKGVVKSIRRDIIESGGEVRFNSRVSDIVIKNGRAAGVKVTGESEYTEDFDYIILAVGHSARDTFRMLYEKGVKIEPKPFSIGARIEHLQKSIDLAQYGGKYDLPPADYRLSARLDGGRAVYTFCMCPGGRVVAAASEEGALVTNGMSEFKRDMENANSALLVSVSPSDFESSHPLAGVEFQRKYERLAYSLGGEYRAPAQKVGDFLTDKLSAGFGEVKPSYLPGTVFSKLSDFLPAFAVSGIKDGIRLFNNKLRGFSNPDAVLTGLETRSSSPLRIVRDERGESNIPGLFPCGEGSGYSGGITSSAVDGIKAALNIIAAAKDK